MVLFRVVSLRKGFPGVLSGKDPACQCRRRVQSLGQGRAPGDGNGNAPQYSCPVSSMDQEEPGRLISVGLQRVGHDRTRMHVGLRPHIGTPMSGNVADNLNKGSPRPGGRHYSNPFRWSNLSTTCNPSARQVLGNGDLERPSDLPQVPQLPRIRAGILIQTAFLVCLQT